MKKKVAAARAAREARIAELRAACQALNNERADLESVNEREEAAPWIGRCFKYRSRDSSGRAWWIYIRIVKHEHGNSFLTLQCKAQSGGWHIAATGEHVYLLPDPKQRGFIEIPRRAFNTAWHRFTRHIEALNR